MEFKKTNHIDILNRYLEFYKAPLDVRLTSKYLLSVLSIPEVCFFFSCKLLEFRIDDSFLQNNFKLKIYSEKEKELVKKLNYNFNFEMNFVNDFTSIYKFLSLNGKNKFLAAKKENIRKLKKKLGFNYEKDDFDNIKKKILSFSGISGCKEKKITNEILEDFYKKLNKIEELHEDERIINFDYKNNSRNNLRFLLSFLDENYLSKFCTIFGFGGKFRKSVLDLKYKLNVYYN